MFNFPDAELKFLCFEWAYDFHFYTNKEMYFGYSFLYVKLRLKLKIAGVERVQAHMHEFVNEYIKKSLKENFVLIDQRKKHLDSFYSQHWYMVYIQLRISFTN